MYLDHLNIVEWADKYVSEELDAEQMATIEATLTINPDLKKEWDNTISMLHTFRQMNERKKIRMLFSNVKAEIEETRHNKFTTVISFIRSNWKVTSVAAAVAITASTLSYKMGINKQQVNNQYQVLRRDIDRLKAGQNAMASSSIPTDPGKFGGSGFAISNNGYVATNYHVIAGSDSVYIQTADGSYHKVYVAAVEPSNDLAILKIADSNFRFSNTGIPYSISRSSAGLGRKIYSLGYPQYDIVYNEGYISSRYGYEGDTSAYQLDITANPGQSGSPVFDNNGNILALITAKETNVNGATFAVKSGELIDLASSIKYKENITLPRVSKMPSLGNREEQIDKLKNFVVSVKVYK